MCYKMTSFIEKMIFNPIYRPRPLHIEDSPGLYFVHEIVIDLYYIKTRLEHTIPAYYIRHPDSKYTIIYSHDSDRDIVSLRQLMVKLVDALIVNIICYDYSGYSWSRGPDDEILTPSEKYAYTDIRAVYDYCVNNLKVKKEDIILMGRSLGTGPTVHLALNINPKAVILESSFLSAMRNSFDLGFTLPFDIFVNIDKIQYIKAPLLIIHGDKDTSFKAGLDLYEKATSTKDCLWIVGASHDNIETLYWALYINKIRDFIDGIQ